MTLGMTGIGRYKTKNVPGISSPVRTNVSIDSILPQKGESENKITKAIDPSQNVPSDISKLSGESLLKRQPAQYQLKPNSPEPKS